MTVELLKGRGKLRRLLCSLLAALMLLPWVMQGAWAAGGTREVKSREIAVVFDNSGSMYDAGSYGGVRFGPHGVLRRRQEEGTPLHHIPQVYGQSSGQVRHGAGAGGGGQPLDPSR